MFASVDVLLLFFIMVASGTLCRELIPFVKAMRPKSFGDGEFQWSDLAYMIFGVSVVVFLAILPIYFTFLKLN